MNEEESRPDEEASQPGPSHGTGGIDQPASRTRQSETRLPEAPPRDDRSRTARWASPRHDVGDAGESAVGASLREQKVIDLYYRVPIAARVAQELGLSERHVRRIVEKRRPELNRRRDRDEREIAERTFARRSGIADWADGAQQQNLDALDALLESGEETVRLRAIKMRQDLIDHVTMLSAPRSELEDALMSKELEISEELRRVRFEDLIQENGEESDHE
jgi:sirohydrochlorin ferrochelatase